MIEWEAQELYNPPPDILASCPHWKRVTHTHCVGVHERKLCRQPVQRGSLQEKKKNLLAGVELKNKCCVTWRCSLHVKSNTSIRRCPLEFLSVLQTKKSNMFRDACALVGWPPSDCKYKFEFDSAVTTLSSVLKVKVLHNCKIKCF